MSTPLPPPPNQPAQLQAPLLPGGTAAASGTITQARLFCCQGMQGATVGGGNRRPGRHSMPTTPARCPRRRPPQSGSMPPLTGSLTSHPWCQQPVAGCRGTDGGVGKEGRRGATGWAGGGSRCRRAAQGEHYVASSRPWSRCRVRQGGKRELEHRTFAGAVGSRVVVGLPGRCRRLKAERAGVGAQTTTDPVRDGRNRACCACRACHTSFRPALGQCSSGALAAQVGWMPPEVQGEWHARRVVALLQPVSQHMCMAGRLDRVRQGGGGVLERSRTRQPWWAVIDASLRQVYQADTLASLHACEQQGTAAGPLAGPRRWALLLTVEQC